MHLLRDPQDQGAVPDTRAPHQMSGHQGYEFASSHASCIGDSVCSSRTREPSAVLHGANTHHTGVAASSGEAHQQVSSISPPRVTRVKLGDCCCCSVVLLTAGMLRGWECRVSRHLVEHLPRRTRCSRRRRRPGARGPGSAAGPAPARSAATHPATHMPDDHCHRPPCAVRYSAESTRCTAQAASCATAPRLSAVPRVCGEALLHSHRGCGL